MLRYSSHIFCTTCVATARCSYRCEATPSGYRDINISVMFDGHVCEIQIQLAAILQVKAGAHKVTGFLAIFKSTCPPPPCMPP